MQCSFCGFIHVLSILLWKFFSTNSWIILLDLQGLHYELEMKFYQYHLLMMSMTTFGYCMQCYDFRNCKFLWRNYHGTVCKACGKVSSNTGTEQFDRMCLDLPCYQAKIAWQKLRKTIYCCDTELCNGTKRNHNLTTFHWLTTILYLIVKYIWWNDENDKYKLIRTMLFLPKLTQIKNRMGYIETWCIQLIRAI